MSFELRTAVGDTSFQAAPDTCKGLCLCSKLLLRGSMCLAVLLGGGGLVAGSTTQAVHP